MAVARLPRMLLVSHVHPILHPPMFPPMFPPTLPRPSSGFSFAEFGCLRASSSKVVCCHFSPNGQLLASAGHDKKVGAAHEC